MVKVQGVNSFNTKPVTFEALVGMVGDLAKYWFKIVELPLQRTGD